MYCEIRIAVYQSGLREGLKKKAWKFPLRDEFIKKNGKKDDIGQKGGRVSRVHVVIF